jgi:hypothetical protein
MSIREAGPMFTQTVQIPHTHRLASARSKRLCWCAGSAHEGQSHSWQHVWHRDTQIARVPFIGDITATQHRQLERLMPWAVSNKTGISNWYQYCACRTTNPTDCSKFCTQRFKLCTTTQCTLNRLVRQKTVPNVTRMRARCILPLHWKNIKFTFNCSLLGYDTQIGKK